MQRYFTAQCDGVFFPVSVKMHPEASCEEFMLHISADMFAIFLYINVHFRQLKHLNCCVRWDECGIFLLCVLLCSELYNRSLFFFC